MRKILCFFVLTLNLILFKNSFSSESSYIPMETIPYQPILAINLLDPENDQNNTTPIVDFSSEMFTALLEDLQQESSPSLNEEELIDLAERILSNAITQSYLEGFDLLINGPHFARELDISQIVEIWQHGSIIRSNFLREVESRVIILEEISDDDALIISQSNLNIPLIKSLLKLKFNSTLITNILKKIGGERVKNSTSQVLNEVSSSGLQSVTVGIIGLGRMGSGIAERLINRGIKVYGYDINPKVNLDFQNDNFHRVNNLKELIENVDVFWLLVPAGDAVDKIIEQLRLLLSEHFDLTEKKFIFVDGGNSNFENSLRRYRDLEKLNIFFYNCGTSGGLVGRTAGYSLMVSGNEEGYEMLRPMFNAIAWPPREGQIINHRVGGSATGHFVKMIHNGIEYALLQAYAEVLYWLKSNGVDIRKVIKCWNKPNSRFRSFISELIGKIIDDHGINFTIPGVIGDNGTGRWTVATAKEYEISVPLIEQSIKTRNESRKSGGNWFTQLIAWLRMYFGGHKFESGDTTK